MCKESSPRSRERGHILTKLLSKEGSSFNPRPAHASGTTGSVPVRTSDSHVSIRAPLTRAGRQSAMIMLATLVAFQSAPRSRERGDRARFQGELGPHCFNPRPAHASGATRPIIGLALVGPVSIRAPLTRAGRQLAMVMLWNDMVFQSAPRSRERGDRF